MTPHDHLPEMANKDYVPTRRDYAAVLGALAVGGLAFAFAVHTNPQEAVCPANAAVTKAPVHRVACP